MCLSVDGIWIFVLFEGIGIKDLMCLKKDFCLRIQNFFSVI